MDLDELTRVRKAGGGLLTLGKDTATDSEREAAAQLLADATCRLMKANNAGFAAGQADATKGMEQKIENAKHIARADGYNDGLRQGRELAVSDQAVARREVHHGIRHEEDGSRTLCINEYQVRNMDQANRLRGLMADRITIVARDYGMPQGIRDYLEREVLEPLQASIEDAKRRPKHHDAAGNQLVTVRHLDGVLKRLQDLEVKCGELGAKVTPAGFPAGADTLPGVVKKLETNTMSRAAGEDVFRRLKGLEEWQRAVAARLNAIEIWKNDELANILSEKTRVLETHDTDIKQLKGYAQNAASLSSHTRLDADLGNMRTDVYRRLDALDEGDTKATELYEWRGRFLPEFRRQLDEHTSKLNCFEGHVLPELAGRVAGERGTPVSEPKANPITSIDEAFENWRATPWGDDKLNEYFATAPVEWHRALTAVMEQSFRAGWAVCLAGGKV